VQLTLRYPKNPGLPEIVVDGDPESCARFVKALGEGCGAPTAEKTAEKPAPRVPSRRAASQRARSKRQDGVRQYRGRPNRRHTVLEAIRALTADGVAAPDLDQIRDRYARLFPEESQRHLDQVVRDLVNKTGHLQRTAEGSFRLSEEDRVGGGMQVLEDAF